MWISTGEKWKTKTSLNVLECRSQATIVSSSAVNGVASGGAPTAMYRPNFSQAFQRAGPTTVPPTLSAGLYPTQSFTSGLLSNGTQSNTRYWCLLFFFIPFILGSAFFYVANDLFVLTPLKSNDSECWETGTRFFRAKRSRCTHFSVSKMKIKFQEFLEQIKNFTFYIFCRTDRSQHEKHEAIVEPQVERDGNDSS